MREFPFVLPILQPGLPVRLDAVVVAPPDGSTPFLLSTLKEIAALLSATPVLTFSTNLTETLAPQHLPLAVVGNLQTLAALQGTFTHSLDLLIPVPMLFEQVAAAREAFFQRWERLTLGQQHLYAQLQMAENVLVQTAALGYRLHDDVVSTLPEKWFNTEGKLSPSWTLVHETRSLKPTCARPALLNLPKGQRSYFLAPAGSRWWGVKWPDLEMRLLAAQSPAFQQEFGFDGTAAIREPLKDLLMAWFGFATPTTPPADDLRRLDIVAQGLGAPLLDVPLTDVAQDVNRTWGRRTWARLMQEAAVFLYQRLALIVTRVQAAAADSPRTWRGFDNVIMGPGAALYFTLDDRIPPDAVAAVLRQLDATPWGLSFMPEILMGASWGSLSPVTDAFADIRAQLEMPTQDPVVCSQCGKVAASERDLQQHLVEEHA